MLRLSTLNFTVAVRGSLTPAITADALGVEFRDAAGATVLTYAGLKVWDADGKPLASHFAPLDTGCPTLVTLLVEERGARYPLTIDPIAQQAYLKPAAVGTSQAGNYFGISVAVSGDTVVVGALGEDSSTLGVNSWSSCSRCRTTRRSSGCGAVIGLHPARILRISAKP